MGIQRMNHMLFHPMLLFCCSFTSEPCNRYIPFWLPGSSRVELPAKTAGQGIGEIGDCDILGAICSMLGLFL